MAGDDRAVGIIPLCDCADCARRYGHLEPAEPLTVHGADGRDYLVERRMSFGSPHHAFVTPHTRRAVAEVTGIDCTRCALHYEDRAAWLAEGGQAWDQHPEWLQAASGCAICARSVADHHWDLTVQRPWKGAPQLDAPTWVVEPEAVAGIAEPPPSTDVGRAPPVQRLHNMVVGLDVRATRGPTAAGVTLAA